MTACVGLETVTVQLAMLPVVSVFGVHCRLVTQGALVNCSNVDFVIPFQETAICAISSVSTALMSASNVRLLCPAGIENAKGTLTFFVLLSTEIVAPEVEGAVRVTMQLTAPPVSKRPGGQTIPLKPTLVTKATVERSVTPELAEIDTF
jgi:hypothetical protein